MIGLAALVLLPSLVEMVGPGRHQCVLKELFVAESSRSEGVGGALLRASASYALEQGCGRMDWNVKAENADGIRFYERHGARVVGDRLSYRVEGDDCEPRDTADELRRNGRTSSRRWCGDCS